MDDGRHRENKRHRIDGYQSPLWNAASHYEAREQNAFAKLVMICDERDAAFKDRDRAFAEKNAALAERDAAIQQRDSALIERDNARRERDNAIAALQFHESTFGAVFTCAGEGRSKPAHFPGENSITDWSGKQVGPYQITEPEPKPNKNSRKPTGPPKKSRKMGKDLNRRVTTDWSKAEWDAGEFGPVDSVPFDESTMPPPVCSCTGVARQCYKWGNGGWQSACCTTSLSVYPLPQMPNKKHSRVSGRKMSGSVFTRLLTRLVSSGHDVSIAVDLKSYWAKHGTNRYITIK